MPNDDAVGKGGWGGVKMSLKVMTSYLYVPLVVLMEMKWLMELSKTHIGTNKGV